MIDRFRIAERYCGPAGSGNGGYVAGSLARRTQQPVVEVTLRAAAPLERELTVSSGADSWSMHAGTELIATARAAELDLALPEIAPWAQVRAVLASYVAPRPHPAPICFVCGNARPRPDGLQLRVMRVRSGAPLTGIWRAPAEFGTGTGSIGTEIVWAALDCPGGMALLDPQQPMVTGRMTVRIDAPIMADTDYLIAAWRIGHEGRKHYAGTAICTPAGTVCAIARSVWIELR
jgi:hypothetical protein